MSSGKMAYLCTSQAGPLEATSWTARPSRRCRVWGLGLGLRCTHALPQKENVQEQILAQWDKHSDSSRAEANRPKTLAQKGPH